MNAPLLSDKVALITGGSRGLGAAIASRFAEEGCAVIISYHTQADQAEAVVGRITTSGGKALAIQADVSVEADVERLFAAAQDAYGSLDILVNSAGILKNNLLLTTSVSDFDALMATNVRGTFLCTRAALKQMAAKRRGSIINLSSIAGVYGNRGQSAYAASKAAIIGFTKSVAKEAGAFGVTVNALAPGFIDTDMTRAIDERVRSTISQTIALGRTGEAAEVADAALFLASPLSRYVSGQVLGVDGCQIL